MKKSYAIAVLLLLIFAAGVYFLLNNQGKQPVKKNSVNRNLPKEVTVILDQNGFSPKEVTIKQGTAVRWENKSGGKQSVNSDDHPTHQMHRELNFGVFINGATFAYIFKKPGMYGYHNHLNPDQTGKIIVEE